MVSKRLISFEMIAENSPMFHDLDERPNWPVIFQNDNPIKLEIGFGNGNFLIEMAIREPQVNFIGIDMFHKGIRKVFTRVEKICLTNIHVAYGDARTQVPLIFNDRQLTEVFINFPDPWPKKRHYKRRLIKPIFIEALANKLEPCGTVHLATDFASYAEEIRDLFEADLNFKNGAGPKNFSESRKDLPKTKYENNFLNAGERIFYLDFIRK